MLLASYLHIAWDYTIEESLARIHNLLFLAPKKKYKTEGEEAIEDDLELEIATCLQGLKNSLELNFLDLDQLDIDE